MKLPKSVKAYIAESQPTKDQNQDCTLLGILPEIPEGFKYVAGKPLIDPCPGLCIPFDITKDAKG
ncbi:16191_t:CDS:2 [Dentiscutata erythropus]|uniref:16191_t:CDS:1 n=1 Tax=Dentiscutata erythropus TaxID=1348616 RepID=A0A9N9FY40_9GLOM|nr:16191_t:CDS:2 [Dentiscutata erythropus]